MKPDLKPGATEEQTITTTKDMGIVHLGPPAPSMYSTPAMVSLIEATCLRLLTPFLGPGEQTVGFHIAVPHLAPTPIGKRVTAKVRLAEINGRRYKFDVEVVSEDGVKIGEGIHERALIDISRFAQTAQA